MSKHNFAQQVLKYSNVFINCGEYEIPDEDIEVEYNLDEEFNTRLLLNKHLSTVKKPILMIGYEDLEKLGFQITKQRVSSKFFKYQNMEYLIIRQSPTNIDVGGIPKDHYIEYNYQENWVRLVGTNSSGKKVYLYRHDTIKRDSDLSYADLESIYTNYVAETSPFTYEEPEKRKLIYEIPWVVTDDGKTVCLPRTKDMPKIGIFGKTGTGKTIVMHTTLDGVHFKWGQRCAVMNDNTSFQTKSWSLPWDTDKLPDFAKRLNYVGHTTRPLPLLYLFPSSEDLASIELEGEVSFKIALSFRDIMSSNPDKFFEGIESLGASSKYLQSLCFDDNGKIRSDGLIYAKKIEQIKDLINEQIVAEQEITKDGVTSIEKKKIYKMPEGVRSKLWNLLREVWNSQIFDITSSINSKWILQKYDEDKKALYPWNACLDAGVVPVFITSNIKSKKYFPSYYRFILEDMFDRQSNDTLLQKNETELWLFIDEMKDLMKHQTIFSTIKQHMAMGRPNRVGYVYATQFFGDIPEDIELNTDYIISFQQTKMMGKAILENFDSLKSHIDLIRKLPKMNAIVAGKVGEPLVVYDTEGNREVIDDGTPFKGTIFPPVSQHSPPKSHGI